MDDKKIIALYFERSENAITETHFKYGRFCYRIAYNILSNEQDAEECVNDTYIKVWNTIPPHKPKRFAAFLGRITRNIALNKYRYNTGKKRNDGQTAIVLEELYECIPSANSENMTETIVIRDAISRFLLLLPAKKRQVFMRRYWYIASIKEIAKDYGMSESKVKMMLLRTREELKLFLEKEDIEI